MKRNILITGISGQDGAILAKLLYKKYNIYGITRNKSKRNLRRLIKLKIYQKIIIYKIDLLDLKSLEKFLSSYQFSHIYNFAGYSSVKDSVKNDKLSNNINVNSLFNILNYYRDNNKIKIFHSLSSEIFGNTNQTPQNEKTLLVPVTPYGFSKKINFLLLREYRKFYNLKIYSAIFYNHNSELSSEDFVINKIALAFKKFKNKEKHTLKLGNINVKRDWGCAQEYMEGVIKILASKKPNDYIISTGKLYSIKELILIAGKLTSLKICWKNSNNLIATIDNNKYMKIEIDNKLVRKKDTGKQSYYLTGSTYKIKKNLNWKPKIKATDLLKKLIFNK